MRDDCIAEIVNAAMLDRQSELLIDDAGSRTGFGGRHDDKPPIDLLPPVHSRRVLLPDEAALGEADAVELDGVAFEPEDVTELRPALADTQAQTVLEPAGSRLIRFAEPSPPKLLQPRVDASGAALQRPVHCNSGLPVDSDRPAQPVDRQPLHKVVGGSRLAVEKQVLAFGPHDEVEQAFALWRQQSGPDRKVARDVVGHQSLEEAAYVLAREANDCAVGQGGRGH